MQSYNEPAIDEQSWVEKAIDSATAAFKGYASSKSPLSLEDDSETILADLLADLMHWADKHEVDFQNALKRGRSHWEAESSGEEI